ncbi:MAG: 3-phosphoshikimate 1-carboxyvinyltransferase [Acidobacteriota bacterium]
MLAARRGRFRLHGDASLSRRPMKRVTELLSHMGARFEGGDGLPLIVHGGDLRAANLSTAVASAQVKSALILAALQASGTSVIEEPAASRDHTERMLAAMGAPLQTEGARVVRVTGGNAALSPLDLDVPGDPSSAAFAIALACLRPGSQVTVENLSLNPRRLGFYRLLSRMGARIEFARTQETPEQIGFITAIGSRLHGIQVEPEEIVDAIDELPLLATVAAAATGPTTIRGAAELRHKESDRITSTVAMLRAFGAVIDELPDGFEISGDTAFVPAHVDAHSDHRIAMSATIAAALAPEPSTLHGSEWVRISYPGFFDDLARLSAGD